MTEVDLCGIGIWSEAFSNWDEFRAVLNGADISSDGTLKPELIPPRERRRAPQSVKLAIEVMQQALGMAGVAADDAATVFASGMGDMQLTDYMCRTLNDMPRAVSPTRFHNSVHNAATGYWSIATQSHAPANAISAYSGSAGIALLEGAIQAIEERLPVLVASEETAPPVPFTSIYHSDSTFGSALLLMPAGMQPGRLACLGVKLVTGAPPLNQATAHLGDAFPGNYAAQILPLLATIALKSEGSVFLPLSARSYLSVAISLRGSK